MNTASSSFLRMPEKLNKQKPKKQTNKQEMNVQVH